MITHTIKILHLVIFLLSMVIIFSACDTKSDNSSDKIIDEDKYTNITNVYKEVKLPFIDNVIDNFYNIFYENGKVFYKQNWDTYNIISLENMHVDTTNLEISHDDIDGFETIRLLSDKNYIAYKYNRDKYIKTLRLLSPEGQVLNEYAFQSPIRNGNVFFDKDENVYYIEDQRIFAFDSNLNEINTIETNFIIERFMQNSYGKLIAQEYTGACYVLDFTNGTVTRTDNYDPPDIIDQYYQVFFAEGYDVYYSDKNGVYGVTDGTAVLLLDWENSGISYNNTTILNIIDENTFLVRILSQIITNPRVVLLERVPDDEVALKVIVKLAQIHTIIDFDLLYEAIANFNSRSDTYKIELIDYTEYDQAPDYDGGIKRFNEDITSGNIPDIVIMNGFKYDAENYISKGLFTDISQSLAENDTKLLPCVLDAYKTEDAIYQIPCSMRISTLATKASNAGTSLTLDAIYTDAEALSENQTLFSQPVIREMCGITQFDFVDFDNKSCNFDSDDYIKFVEFTDNLMQYTDKSKGALVMIDRFAYGITSTALTDELSSGELKYLKVPMNTIDGYISAKLCFGDTDFVLCGYPSKDGNSSWMLTDMRIAITENSDVKDGAFAFLSYLLSDEIQTSYAVSNVNLPVTLSAIEKLLEKSNYLYNPTPNQPDSNGIIDLGYFAKYSDDQEEMMNRGQQPFIKVKLTDKDKKALLDFFSTTTFRATSNDTISDIIDEELDAYYGDSRSLPEAAKIIQNRVTTYLNE